MQQPGPTRILTVTDGRAGNVRQARALADALALPARELVLAPRAPWRWIAPRRAPLADRAFGDDLRTLLDDSAALRATLAIGCGRQAALATRLLHEHGARVVQVLDPRLHPAYWDVVIAPRHDDLRAPNVIDIAGSLNPVHDGWLGASRAAFAELGRLPAPRIALLVGGPSAHMRLSAGDLDAWLATVRTRVERDGGSVLATTSRRTPKPLVARVRARLRGLPGLVWTDTGDGRNPYAGLLGWADRIVCTADSVNMLSEACATTAPVFIAGVERLSGRPRRYVDDLLQRGRAHRLDATMAPFAVEPLRETRRVALLLRERFGLPAA